LGIGTRLGVAFLGRLAWARTFGTGEILEIKERLLRPDARDILRTRCDDCLKRPIYKSFLRRLAAAATTAATGFWQVRSHLPVAVWGRNLGKSDASNGER